LKVRYFFTTDGASTIDIVFGDFPDFREMEMRSDMATVWKDEGEFAEIGK
jgi:hypothetical protein